MKQILLATSILAFAWAQASAQNPATVSGKKEVPTVVQPTDAVLTTTKTADLSTVNQETKSTPVITPSTVRNGKPVVHRIGTPGKKRVMPVTEKNAPVKPIASGKDEKK